MTPPVDPPVLGRVAGGLDLHFSEEVGEDRPTGDASPQVRGVHAVHDEAILRTARPVDLQAAGAGLVVGARGGRHDAREIPSARNPFDEFLGDACRRGILLDVDDGGFSGDLHRFGNTREPEGEVDLQDLPEHQGHIADLLLGKSSQRGGQFVAPRRQRRKTIGATLVRHGRAHPDDRRAAGFNRHTRQHSAGRVLDDALDRSSLLLRGRHGRQQQYKRKGDE